MDANDNVAMARPFVATRGDNEIHLIWAQGPLAYRWHESSSDGGLTWSHNEQIYPDLNSQTNSQAFATDSDGNLYWADVLRYKDGAYLMRWTGTWWSDPELFYLIEQDPMNPRALRAAVHFMRMDISQGNLLLVVFVDLQRADIWTMQKILPARQLPAQAIPTPAIQPTSHLTATPRRSTPENPTPGILLDQTDIPDQTVPSSASIDPFLLAGSIPVCLLLAVVFAVRNRNR